MKNKIMSVGAVLSIALMVMASGAMAQTDTCTTDKATYDVGEEITVTYSFAVDDSYNWVRVQGPQGPDNATIAEPYISSAAGVTGDTQSGTIQLSVMLGDDWPLAAADYKIDTGGYDTGWTYAAQAYITVAAAAAEGEGEGEEPVGATVMASTNFPKVGGALTLSAPTGAAAPFQWYLDDIALTGATESTLSFPIYGTSNYGLDTDDPQLVPLYASYPLTYNAASITMTNGGTVYLPSSESSAQTLSIDDEAWVFEATFVDTDMDTQSQIGLSGNGGYKELYADFYAGTIRGTTGVTTTDITGATSVALRMTSTAAEIVCEANIDGAGYVSVGAIAHGTGSNDYKPWIYEAWGYSYTGYDVDISDVSLSGYGIANVNPALNGVQTSDFGAYSVSYDDGTKAIVTSDYFTLSALFPEGSAVPAASLVGLGLLAGMGLVGGVLRSRKK